MGKQSMAPIATALGREVPRCDITVGAVSLVIQWGPERLWNWQPVGTANLGALPGLCTGKGTIMEDRAQFYGLLFAKLPLIIVPHQFIRGL